jgi:hypothetical protein
MSGPSSVKHLLFGEENHLMNEKPLRVMVEDYDAALKDYGLACVTRLHMLSRISALIRTHELRGKDSLDRDIIAEAYRETNDRIYRGEILKANGQIVLRSLERFLHFVDTGEIKVPSNPKGSLIVLLPQLQEIVDGFLSSGNFHPNTRNDMRWVAHKYFEWLAGTAPSGGQLFCTPRIKAFISGNYYNAFTCKQDRATLRSGLSDLSGLQGFSEVMSGRGGPAAFAFLSLWKTKAINLGGSGGSAPD